MFRAFAILILNTESQVPSTAKKSVIPEVYFSIHLNADQTKKHAHIQSFSNVTVAIARKRFSINIR